MLLQELGLKVFFLFVRVISRVTGIPLLRERLDTASFDTRIFFVLAAGFSPNVVALPLRKRSTLELLC